MAGDGKEGAKAWLPGFLGQEGAQQVPKKDRKGHYEEDPRAPSCPKKPGRRTGRGTWIFFIALPLKTLWGWEWGRVD